MHECSIDVEHGKILFYLSLLSILISSTITTILNELIVKIPNLNREWKIEFEFSYHKFNNILPVILIIKQTWSKLCIKGEFNHSKSSSNTASLKINDRVEIKLLYSYHNDKIPQYHEMGTINYKDYANLEIKKRFN